MTKYDKLNTPVDKPKQVRRRKPIEDKKTADIKAYQKEYRLKNKEKIAKVEKQKNYLNNDDLLQQIILCKAQGSISADLTNMIQQIANGISRRLYYDNLEDKKDCIQEGIIHMILNYHKFNENKYDNPLAYLSEICKRGMVRSWNEIHYRKQYRVLGTKTKQTEFLQLPVINCEWL